MMDRIGDALALLITGAVAVHIFINPNSKGTISAIFDGVASDISASVN